MSTNFVKVHKWQEFHENGQLWIDGEIAIVPETLKHLHDYRDGWYDNGKYFIPKDIPVCRIGVWTKFFDNGQIACEIDYVNGMRDSKIKRSILEKSEIPIFNVGTQLNLFSDDDKMSDSCMCNF